VLRKKLTVLVVMAMMLASRGRLRRSLVASTDKARRTPPLSPRRSSG
jgi:hypothetical protein